MGKIPAENGGGDQKEQLFKDRRDTIIAFIKWFKCTESRYCHAKSGAHVYFQSDLNIHCTWTMFIYEYKDFVLNVSKYFFQDVFCMKFNIDSVIFSLLCFLPLPSPATFQCVALLFFDRQCFATFNTNAHLHFLI